MVAAGVLSVISDAFLTLTRIFSNREPRYHSKANDLSYGHTDFQSDQLHIRGEWAFGSWPLSRFQCYRPGVQRVTSDGFLTSIRAFSVGAVLYFLKVHDLSYKHINFENNLMGIRGEWASRKWP